MKIRKAVKRLNKIETLLVDVIGGLRKGSNGTGDILASAKESILRAKTELESKKSANPAKKLSAEARSSGPVAGKKRSTAARRKGMYASKKHSLKQTA